jgi:hypothetical protein
MPILLFTDFGARDLYVGQVELAITAVAPRARIVHLLHDAPAFAVRASAHLLAALVAGMPRGSVVMAVVDPGVGTARRGVVLKADERWFVGPDNGLLAVLAARAEHVEVWHVRDVPPSASPTFHGRDLFAPLAARIDAGRFPSGELAHSATLDVPLPAGDLPELIYFDHYGNAFTGIRGAHMAPGARLRIAAESLAHARTFGNVLPNTAFWYVNSQGLVEVAVNGASAREALGLALGQAVTIEA